MAKITQNELNTLAESVAKSTGSRYSLALVKLRKECEAKGFDTPSNKSLAMALDFVVGKAITSMAEGEGMGIVSQSASVKASGGDYRVHRQTVSDVGSAKPGAVASYELNRYVNGIKREGKNALSTKLRQKVIDLFNALAEGDLKDVPLETISLANRFKANAELVEAEAVAHYDTELAKKRAKAEKDDALRQAQIDAAAKTLAAERAAKKKGKQAPVNATASAVLGKAKAEALAKAKEQSTAQTPPVSQPA
jgi:hypothetical protein